MEKSTEKNVSYVTSGNSINSKLRYPLRSALRSKEGKLPVPDFSASVPRRYVDDEPTDNALRFYKWFTEEDHQQMEWRSRRWMARSLGEKTKVELRISPHDKEWFPKVG